MRYSYIKGEFKCFTCGFVMDEVDWEEDEEDETDIPFGCLACGGPYPFCQTSCNLFDD